VNSRSKAVSIACAVLLVGGCVALQWRPQTSNASIRASSTESTVSYGALAKRLAGRLIAAKTGSARYKAVLAVMKALHVGVYTSRGKPVVRGAERNLADFYLYKIQVSGLAGGMGHTPSGSISGLADSLASAGIRLGGSPITGESLRTALLAGVRAAAARPKSQFSLVPLLIRELGLRHRASYDLTRDVPETKLRLDALQSFLLGEDFLVPFIRKSSFADTTSFARRAGGLLRSDRSQPAAADCSGLSQPPQKIQAWLFLLLNKGATPAQIAQGRKAKAEAQTASLMDAFTVTGDTNSIQATHYGPPGHDTNAGKELKIQLRVEFTPDSAKLSDYDIRCGWLKGTRFPKPGPVPNVSMNWKPGPIQSLEQHGTVSYEPANTKTGRNGVATLIFKPKDEIVPGFGSVKNEEVVVFAKPTLLRSIGHLPNSIDAGSPAELTGDAIKVSWHAPRGFHVKGPYTFETSEDSEIAEDPADASVHELLTTVDADLHICGDDPYFHATAASMWTGTVTVSVLDRSEGMSSAAPPTALQLPIRKGVNQFGLYTIEFIPGPPAHLHVHPLNGPGDTDLPITEDKTCP
jgi:hypothetical protein